MAINVYMQNQGFSKCIIRMFFFHKQIMEYGICVKTSAQFLLLWHLNIEIKADYRKNKTRSFGICYLRKISTIQ